MKHHLLLCLVLILILALGIRAAYLDRAFMGDELPGWVLPAKDLADTGKLYYSAETSSCGKIEQIYGLTLNCSEAETFTGVLANPAVKVLHPPLGYYVYAAFHALSPAVGVEVSQRLAPFLFTAGIFALIFLTGKLLFNTRTGLLAAFVGAVSTYAVFHGAFRVDVDGAFVTFFVLAAFYSYARWFKNGEKTCLYAAGILLGLAVLTRLSAAAFPVFFAALEVFRTRKPAVLLPLLVVPGLVFGGWAAAEIAGGDQAYVNAVLGYNVPVKEEITPLSFIADKAVGAFSLARDLSVPLACLALLAFAALKWRPLRKQLFKPEVLAALFVVFILVLTLAPYRGEKQRYFTVALPFVFLLAGWFLSRYNLKNKVTVASFAVFAVLFAVFKPHDHMLWTYELTGNALPLVVLALPAVLLVAAWKYKPQAVSALFGAYLAFSTVFLVMGFSNLFAYSAGAQAGLEQQGVLIAGRNEAVKEVFWYDWLDNRVIDKNNTYVVLNTTQQMTEFGATHAACQTVYNHDYPVVFVCKK